MCVYVLLLLNMEHTTIQISPKIRDELKNVLRKSETYDEGIARLIRSASNTEGIQKHGK